LIDYELDLSNARPYEQFELDLLRFYGCTPLELKQIPATTIKRHMAVLAAEQYVKEQGGTLRG